MSKKCKLKIVFKYYFSANKKILRHKCSKYVYSVLWNTSSFWNKPSDARSKMKRPGGKMSLAGILVCGFPNAIFFCVNWKDCAEVHLKNEVEVE